MNEIVSYNEGNGLGLLSIILSIGYYFKFAQKDFWNSLSVNFNYSPIYSLLILMIGVVGLAFWIMSIGYIFLTFINKNSHDLKNSKKDYYYTRSKYFLALSIVFLIISSLLYFNAQRIH